MPLSRVRRLAGIGLLAVPLFSLALNGISWLRFGIDLPFLDDFRVFERETALSLDLKNLFTPSNDTLYPVGLALDALAHRYLSGNSIAYQFLSMMVLLGGLLWLQWRLLSTCVPDRLIAAGAFFLSVFMLQPGSYWGLQNLAYHQGLPALFILAVVAMIVDRNWKSWWGVPAVFVLGLLSGLTYVSGAVASFAAAITLLGFARFGRPHNHAALAGGASLLAASTLTVAAQAWVIFVAQGGHILSDPTVTWALPIEPEFWLYMLGVIGRALALSTMAPGLALAVTAGVCAVALSLAVTLLARSIKGRQQAPGDANMAIVYVTLSAVVFAYLAALAAGRANLRSPESDTALEIFSSGFLRFHHFWVTLLFPWLAAATYVVLRDNAHIRAVPAVVLVPVLSLVVVGAGIDLGMFSHHDYYRGLQTMRMGTDVRCLQEALSRGDAVACPQMSSGDFTPALQYARLIGSSFVRYFPFKAIPFGTDSPGPIYRLSISPPESLDVSNVPAPVRTPDGLRFDAGDDPILVVKLPPGTLRWCRELTVAAMVRVEHNDTAELFLLPHGQSVFTAPSTSRISVTGHKTVFSELAFLSISQDGWEDRIRFDPVSLRQPFTVKDLEVRCHIERRPR